MNKSMKPGAAAQRPLTEEERKEQMTRAFLQKKASLAEAILFNLVQGEGRAMIYDLESKSSETKHLEMVKMASDMADEFMRVVYGREMTIKEPSAEK